MFLPFRSRRHDFWSLLVLDAGVTCVVVGVDADDHCVCCFLLDHPRLTAQFAVHLDSDFGGDGNHLVLSANGGDEQTLGGDWRVVVEAAQFLHRCVGVSLAIRQETENHLRGRDVVLTLDCVDSFFDRLDKGSHFSEFF